MKLAGSRRREVRSRRGAMRYIHRRGAMRHYDGGARRLLPDGSIEIVGRWRIAAWPLVVLILVSPLIGVQLMFRYPSFPPPLVMLAVIGLALGLPRLATRRVLFDAGAKVLRMSDRGMDAEDRTVAFPDIHALTIEQREPRRVANAPRVLCVNGEELLSVKETFANAHLEMELQRLVGLPFRATPRDPGSWMEI
jgi:short subunit dehydrogenase-like uncharacterized protein